MHLLLRRALLMSPSLHPQVVVLILALVSSARVMKKLKQLRRDQLKLTDARVKATNEALLAIRVVQSNSWENALGAQIDEIRAQELALIRKTAFLQAYVKFLYFAIQVMVALSTFVTFAGLGGVLRASDIFSCIALFALMQVRKHLTWLRNFAMKT
jgi:ABC-type multidrug transport system fused ATPase/permease subunit